MVVRAVEDGLFAVGREGPGDVRPDGPGPPRLLQEGALVRAVRAVGEPVLPDLRRRGDEAQIDRDIRFLRETVHKAQVLLPAVPLAHAADEGAAAEEHVVELPLAQEPLPACFEAHPAVPQGELVLQIGLQGGGVAPLPEGAPGESGDLAEIAVLHRGEGAVRQDQVQNAEER